MRWLAWLPLGVLTVVAGLFVLRQGWIYATISETDVIQRYAADHVARGGAAMTDCFAIPGRAPGVWLEVICGVGGCGPGFRRYEVNRMGGLVAAGEVPCDDAQVRRGLA